MFYMVLIMKYPVLFYKSWLSRFFLLILNEFIAYFLLSADKTGKVLNIALSGAIFNIALNLLVIPKWGLIGAAVVAGLTEFLLLVLFFRTINNLYDRTFFTTSYLEARFVSLRNGIFFDQSFLAPYPINFNRYGSLFCYATSPPSIQ